MESCSVKTEQLLRIEDSEEREDYVEVGIVKYPCYLGSSLFGLTELFTVANRFARSHKDKQHSVIRVTHWQASPTNRTRIELVFDSHPEVGRTFHLPMPMSLFQELHISLKGNNPR